MLYTYASLAITTMIMIDIYALSLFLSISFSLESTKNTADIKLTKHLDYESNKVYSLIVRAWNNYDLAAETVIDIEVLDVNDNVPAFRELTKGSVLENEPPGVPVMQVRAIDADGTSAHNKVRTVYFQRQDYFQCI